ncbi:glycosyltransferase [Jiangella mangrovi]|uniref:MGT family glycosyltransferase n=1 Tax=Jiangella mangrovi TaxID=1524084 RepID=A0A7W9LLR5_9ACTN|nr:nucleotide disphospho-sugar-binding domain-containing protein [Jiangella mangrovi]MBB5788441.1 MGT family glycosyltransferase [Jiangella mangrovi]
MLSVLICSTPIHGHVVPLLAVTRHLVEQGHRVRFLTGERWRAAVEDAGAQHLALPAEADYDDRDMNGAFPGRAALSGPKAMRFDMTKVFLAPLAAQLDAVDAALSTQHTDAVLAESLFLAAGAFATRPRATRPPLVYLGIVPLPQKSRNTAPYGLGLPPRNGLTGRIRNAALHALAEKVVFAPVQKDWTRRSASREFVMNWPVPADAIVQFSVPAFEYPRDPAPKNLHFVGPVSRPIAGEQPKPGWWDELDGGRPVVHVTQGTLANQDFNELVGPALAGLQHEDVFVVVSAGGRDPQTLPPLPANARAASYLPYDELLPRTDVMVTNGGYGGVHYAMAYGVPLVVAGKTEDKIEVTARVAWSGAGVDLRTNQPDSKRIVDAVRTVLADPRYRAASAVVGEQIAAAPGVAALERIIADLVDGDPTGTSGSGGDPTGLAVTP